MSKRGLKMMQKNLKWKALLVLAVTLIAVLFLVPTFLGKDLKYWPTQQLNLGLDLKGGMYVVLGVKVDKALRDELIKLEQDLKELWTKKEKITIKDSHITDDNKLIIELADTESFKKAMDYANNNLKSYKATSRAELTIELEAAPDVVSYIKRNALQQARQTIVNRVDEFGVREPEIRTSGTDRIIVSLPGVVEPERAKRLIGKTAALEFKLVQSPNHYARTKEELLNRFGGSIPEGFDVYPQREKDGRTVGYYLLRKEPDFTGRYLADARPGYDEYNLPAVDFRINAEGSKLFERLTGANIGKQLAIVLDNVVMSAPVIRARISTNGQISGSFTPEEANDLAIVLRAGALPVPVEIEEERTVGPTLGEDSIRKGILSLIIGLSAIVIFMIMYYQLGGFIADVAIILNLILILGGLAMFGATLTFPGIAGIVLTLGMAIDANVIIYERIREELRTGKTPRAAVSAGYQKAFWTIFDANLTTLIAGIILFQFGTGPIKGFAVTLTIGIIASMFTAIFVTHLIFDYIIASGRLQRLRV